MNIRKVSLLLGVLFVSSGCKDDAGSAGSGGRAPAPGSPQMAAQFFPMQPGCYWRYSISLGQAKPLHICDIRWPMGERAILQRERGFLKGGLEGSNAGSSQQTFVLEYRVKQAASKQGMLEYPGGVELEILKDELGVFGGPGYGSAKQVFWAKDSSGQVLEVRVRDGERSPARDRGWYGDELDGSELRVIFFPPERGRGGGMLPFVKWILRCAIS